MRAARTVQQWIPMIAIGERIGDYVVERELSRSPVEAVYEAWHVLLPRRALLRVLAGPPQQMVRESRVLEAMRHVGIPRVYECGILPDKRAWLATELVAGHGTDDMLLSLGEVVAMMRDVADALAHAHACFIVHGSLRSDLIVHGKRGVIVDGWGGARIHATDGSDDVRALAEIAYVALFGHFARERRWTGVPAPIATLIERMLGDTPPSAITVRDEAARIATLDLDANIGVEDVELVDIGDDTEEVVLPPRQLAVALRA